MKRDGLFLPIFKVHHTLRTWHQISGKTHTLFSKHSISIEEMDRSGQFVPVQLTVCTGGKLDAVYLKLLVDFDNNGNNNRRNDIGSFSLKGKNEKLI